MSYGEIKIDTITFTAGGVDTSIAVSGLVQNPTFTGNITTTGTISGDIIRGNTVSGVTVTGGTGEFGNLTAVSGVFTTQVSGATVTGNVGLFTTITGGTVNLTSGVFASGTAAAPSVSIGTTDNGLYSPGADQVAISTNGTGRLFIDSSGNMAVGTSSPLTNSYPAFTISNSTQANLYFEDTGYEATGDGVGYFSWDNGALSFTTASRSGTGTTGSTERLRITSAGLVGIGTSSPAELLHVEGATSPTIRIRNSTTGSTASPASTFLSFNGFNQEGRVRFEAQDRRSSVNGGFLNIATANSSNVLTNALHINNAQQVGIGTQSPGTALEVNGAAKTNYAIASGPLSAYASSSGGLYSYFASTAGTINAVTDNSGTAGTLTFATGTERARIDSSGRLLVGTSTARGDFFNVSSGRAPVFQIEGTSTNAYGMSITANSNSDNGAEINLAKSRGTNTGSSTIVQNGDTLARISFQGADGLELVPAAYIQADVDGTPGANDMPGRLVFSVTRDGQASPTEAGRIISSGYAKFTSDGNYNGATGTYHEFYQTSSDRIVFFRNANASPTGIRVNHDTDSNGTGNLFLECVGNTTQRAAIRSNGGLANYSANNANLSDRNAKKDISPAADTWDCIKEWEIVNYRYKDQPDDADLNLGVIAQQVAESCPEVITVFQEATEDEPEKLGVKEQQMYWMAIKALQEAQVRIEALEAEVAALKAQ